MFQGMEASGKTLMLLCIIAQAQRDGKLAAIVDAEHALTPSFARLMGVEFDDLVISRPRTQEQAYDTLKELCSSGLFAVVGYDSVVALPTEEEIKLSASDSQKRAAIAQLASVELRKLNSVMHDETALVLINQLRVNPNPPQWWSSSSPMLYSPGGSALKFYSSMTVQMKSTKTYRDSSKTRIGHRIRAEIKKNKVGVPHQQAEFDLRYESGIDIFMELIEVAIHRGIIEKNGSWYYFYPVDFNTGDVLEEEKWLGREKTEDAFKEDGRLLENLKRQVKDKVQEGATSSAWGDVND